MGPEAIRQFHALQPDAIIYICSVIYVEESKIAKGFEYDNNQNVQTINQYILSTCEDLWYSYYLNLNEIFSDGNHELIPGASADGIHLEPEYCAQMLTYLKSHYISDSDWSQVFECRLTNASAAAHTHSLFLSEPDCCQVVAEQPCNGSFNLLRFRRQTFRRQTEFVEKTIKR